MTTWWRSSKSKDKNDLHTKNLTFVGPLMSRLPNAQALRLLANTPIPPMHEIISHIVDGRGTGEAQEFVQPVRTAIASRSGELSRNSKL